MGKTEAELKDITREVEMIIRDALQIIRSRKPEGDGKANVHERKCKE